MINNTTLTLVHEKFREQGIIISVENLSILLDGTGVWRQCQNEATPDKKLRAGIVSNIYNKYINVSAKDFYLNKSANWQSHQESEQKDLIGNQKKIKDNYDAYKKHVSDNNKVKKHAYSDKKQIDITNDQFVQLDFHNNLVIPITQNGIITGIQTINAKSEKIFSKGSLTKSAYLCYQTEKKNSEIVYFCEGWADGKHIHNITGDTVYICFSVNQLYNVIGLVKKHSKFQQFIVVADNDVHPDRDNVGLEAALKCCKDLKCKVVVPPARIDISDLFLQNGKDEVVKFLENAKTYSEYNQTEELEIDDNFILDDDGVFFKGKKEDVKLSSPIKITAQTCDADGNSWGRVVQVKNNKGKWRTVEISIENLISSQKEVLAALGGNGAIISASGKHQIKLVEYIQNCKPAKMIITTEKTGWIPNKNTFVGYNKCYGKEKENYIYRGYNANAKRKHIETSGTLEQWNENIVAHCELSSRLVFALCLGFTAPILSKLDRQGFNVHFYGISSIGKSTLGQVASSIYGHGQKFMESWKTTASALESIALAHNDLLLVLDEISQANEHMIIDSIYMLANGEGKSRSTPSGENRPTNFWRTIGISNGETSIVDVAQRQKTEELAGGVDVRMVDVNADAGNNKGIFEQGNDVKHTIDLLKENVNNFYGTPGEAWIEYIAANSSELVLDYHKFVKESEFKLEPFDDAKDKYLKEQLTQQAYRVFKNFEIVAYVAKIIAEQNICKLDVFTLHNAIAVCFESWLENRSGGKNREKNELIKRCKEKLSENTYSKFLVHKQKAPFECWGALRILDDNNKIVTQNISTVEGEEDQDQEDYNDGEKPIYFISCTAFHKHLRGSLTTKQALDWLWEEKMLRFQEKSEATLKRQGKFCWMKRFGKLPLQNYYAIEI